MLLRGELFGSGTYVEDTAWSDRNVFFDVREAVALFVNDFSVASDGERAARGAGLCQIGEGWHPLVLFPAARPRRRNAPRP